jgi:dienelactone hydrolase
MEPSMIGAYGPWAASIAGDGPARLSFRRDRFKPDEIGVWRVQARKAFEDRLLTPDTGGPPKAEVVRRWTYDGLDVEQLRWSLPYGPPTDAYFLKPEGAKGRLPAIIGLHDHGGNKYFGARKITKVSDDQHPLMKAHQANYYEGVPWANQLAKRGYAVLVHDAFAFASRRVRPEDVPPKALRACKDVDPATETEAEIKAYNAWASDHEDLMAKSLFSAGTTWPAVFLAEDRKALDYLCSRPDVDTAKIGCSGLSGGGLRTVFLAGADDRIACAVCVGMMTTWRDYLLNKAYTHTWMCYVPGLPLDLDYPEILGLRVPRPTLVLNDIDDGLFTLAEMKRADTILGEVYKKAGAADRYRASFYPGPHKFDRPMQAEAFDWFDQWLKR